VRDGARPRSASNASARCRAMCQKVHGSTPDTVPLICDPPHT
jgi:hypothetical protein